MEKVFNKFEGQFMTKFITYILIVFVLISCSRTLKEEKEFEHIVRDFSNKLYVNYHLFSDRERKDNFGKFKGTWPRTMRVDNPHDTARMRRKKLQNKHK